MTALTLGAHVRYSRVLTRTAIGYASNITGDRGHLKRWEPRDLFPGQTGRTREGILVALRTLTNGRTLWGFEGEPTTYTPAESLRVALVAYDLRRTLERVLVDDLEVLP
jgi:hypothetical protein